MNINDNVPKLLILDKKYKYPNYLEDIRKTLIVLNMIVRPVNRRKKIIEQQIYIKNIISEIRKGLNVYTCDYRHIMRKF